MLQNLSLSKQGLIVLGVILFFELGSVVGLTLLLVDAQEHLKKESHARSVMASTSKIASLQERAGIAIMKRIMPMYLPEPGEKSHHEYARELKEEVRTLKALVRKSPEDLRLVEEMEANINKALPEFDRVREIHKLDNSKIYRKFTGRVHTLSDRTTVLSKEITEHYRKVENREPQEFEQTLENVKHWFAWQLLLNLVLIIFAGVFFVRRIIERLAVILDNVTRFDRGEHLRTKLQGDDELAFVDRLFHEMANTLRSEANREKAILDSAPDIVCSLNEKGQFIRISKAAESQWGFLQDSLVDKSFTHIIHEESQKEFRKALNRVRTDGKATLEARVKANNNRLMHTLWSVNWIAEEEAFFCVVSDFTERKRLDSLLKQKEEQMRLAIEHLPVGLAVVDTAGNIKSANRRMADLYERSTGDLNGVSMDSLLEPAVQLNESVIRQGVKSTRLLALCGEKKIPVEATIESLPSVDNVDALLVVENISDRVELEQTKNAFISLLGNNLRNPLERVSDNLVRYAGSHTLDDKDQKRLDRVGNNIDRLVSMISDLLDLEKLETGKLVGALEVIPVSEVLISSVNSIAELAELNKIKLVYEKGKPLSIKADRNRLEQVVLNLLTNAVKYSDSDSEVKVGSKLFENQVEIRVEDQGKGIAEADREKIFEPFRQVTLADDARGKGTGLGLSICKEIVEAHGGNIGVDSEPGKGSSFWIRIPLWEESS